MKILLNQNHLKCLPNIFKFLSILSLRKFNAIIFRCRIPVILMGETGCGKTRLIKYMCDLRVGASGIRNMVLIKVCNI